MNSSDAITKLTAAYNRRLRLRKLIRKTDSDIDELVLHAGTMAFGQIGADVFLKYPGTGELFSAKIVKFEYYPWNKYPTCVLMAGDRIHQVDEPTDIIRMDANG